MGNKMGIYTGNNFLGINVGHIFQVFVASLRRPSVKSPGEKRPSKSLKVHSWLKMTYFA